MANETNVIPSLRAAGKFEALSPFNAVVNPDTFYTVEAIRTIPEMQALKLNLYALLFQPVGVKEEDYAAILDLANQSGAAVISLTSRGNQPVYVLSTYFKSFPLVDGISYERMCIIIDCGPLPPDMKDALEQTKAHVKSYVADTVGIDAEVQLGTIPTIGYVSAQDALIFETTRKNKITDGNNDIAKIKALEDKLIVKDAYIKELEQRLGVR